MPCRCIASKSRVMSSFLTSANHQYCTQGFAQAGGCVNCADKESAASGLKPIAFKGSFDQTKVANAVAAFRKRRLVKELFLFSNTISIPPLLAPERNYATQMAESEFRSVEKRETYARSNATLGA